MPGVKGHGLCVICNVTKHVVLCQALKYGSYVSYIVYAYVYDIYTVFMFHLSYMHMFMVYIYGQLQKEIGKVFVNVAQTDLQWLKLNKKIKVLR